MDKVLSPDWRRKGVSGSVPVHVYIHRLQSQLLQESGHLEGFGRHLGAYQAMSHAIVSSYWPSNTFVVSVPREPDVLFELELPKCCLGR